MAEDDLNLFEFDQLIYVDCGEDRYEDLQRTIIKIKDLCRILDKIFRTTKKTNWSIKIYLKLNNKVTIKSKRENNYDYSNDLVCLYEIIRHFLTEKGITIELYINDEWTVEDVYRISYADKSTLMLLYGHGIANSSQIVIGTGSRLDDNFDVSTFLREKTDGNLIAGFATCYSKNIMQTQELIRKKICYVSLDLTGEKCSNQTDMFDKMIDIIMYNSGSTSRLFPTSVGFDFNNISENDDSLHPLIPLFYQENHEDEDEIIYEYSDDENGVGSDYDEDNDHTGGSHKKSRRFKNKRTKKSYNNTRKNKRKTTKRYTKKNMNKKRKSNKSKATKRR